MGSALDAALKITAYSPQFTFVLRQKLRLKGFEDQEIETALAELDRAGVLNDKQLAFLYASELVRNKLYGSKMVSAKLMEKGIDKEIIVTAVANAYEENLSEYETCEKFIEKSKIDIFHDDRQKVYRKLAARGFSQSVLSKICGRGE